LKLKKQQLPYNFIFSFFLKALIFIFNFQLAFNYNLKSRVKQTLDLLKNKGHDNFSCTVCDFKTVSGTGQTGGAKEQDKN
jgi:hypothetical protein